jgi:hypothetical protein
VTTEVLLSGAVGALIVFLLGAFREWWREEREREGLLRLLLAEIDHSAEVIRTIGEGTDDLLGSEDFTKVSTDTWRDVQGRAAALLPDDLFAALNVYYSPLQTLLTLRAFENSVSEREVRAKVQMHSELFGMEFAGSRNPWSDYLKATLHAQEQARARIIEYLALQWDDRLLQRVRRWVESRRRPSRTGP